jgi:hypothetical protein
MELLQKPKKLLGVMFEPKRVSKKYKAVIRVNGVLRHLGYFATEQEAHEVYLKAKAEKEARKNG